MAQHGELQGEGGESVGMAKAVVAEKVTLEGLPLHCAHCKYDLFVQERANVWLGGHWAWMRRRQAKVFQCLRCSHLMFFR